MWLSFFVAVVLLIAAIYLPGYIALKGLKLSNYNALVYAPVFGLSFYAILGVFFSFVDVSVSGLILIICCLAIGVIVFLISRLAFNKKEYLGKDSTFLWKSLVLYTLIAIAFSGYLFVRALNGADSFVQFSDNITHLGIVTSFIESGSYSILQTTIYQLDGELFSQSFYPAMWHVLAALVASVLNISASLAINAEIFVVIAFVFSTSIHKLMATLFNENSIIVYLGAFVFLAFAIFPWKFLVFGPLYANLLGYSIMPLFASCFIGIFNAIKSKKCLKRHCFLLIISLVSLAVSHPNTVFSAGVFLVPFICYALYRCFIDKSDSIKDAWKRGIICCICFLVLVFVVWIVAYNLPFMQSTVNFTWDAFTSKSQALVNVLTLAFKDAPAQLALALLVFVGALYTLKNRRYLWISISYILFCLLYVVTASTDGEIKQVLTGFWYTDGYRIAGAAAIAAIPIAAIGLYAIIETARRLLNNIRSTNSQEYSSRLISIVIVTLFVGFNYYPSCDIPGRGHVGNALDYVYDDLSKYNNASPSDFSHYDTEEMKFVERARELIPQEEVVINFPFDGSVYAYGCDNLNILYRQWSYGKDADVFDSDTDVLRESLCDVATSQEVKDALNEIGAEYILLLDQGKTVSDVFSNSYREEDWSGLTSITDETPGFEVVLSEGDMRLYRILD